MQTSVYSSVCQLQRAHVQTPCRESDETNPNVIFVVNLVYQSEHGSVFWISTIVCNIVVDMHSDLLYFTACTSQQGSD